MTGYCSRAASTSGFFYKYYNIIKVQVMIAGPAYTYLYFTEPGRGTHGDRPAKTDHLIGP